MFDSSETILSFDYEEEPKGNQHGKYGTRDR